MGVNILPRYSFDVVVGDGGGYVVVVVVLILLLCFLQLFVFV